MSDGMGWAGFCFGFWFEISHEVTFFLLSIVTFYFPCSYHDLYMNVLFVDIRALL